MKEFCLEQISQGDDDDSSVECEYTHEQENNLIKDLSQREDEFLSSDDESYVYDDSDSGYNERLPTQLELTMSMSQASRLSLEDVNYQRGCGQYGNKEDTLIREEGNDCKVPTRNRLEFQPIKATVKEPNINPDDFAENSSRPMVRQSTFTQYISRYYSTNSSSSSSRTPHIKVKAKPGQKPLSNDKTKRQKVQYNQPTLTQQFDILEQGTCTRSNQPSLYQHYRDTENMYHHFKHGIVRIFKLGEAFRIKGLSEYNASILLIKSFCVYKLRKFAIGTVFQRLHSTQMGGIEFVPPFEKYLIDMRHGLNWSQYTRYEKEQKIPLSKLGDRIEEFDPNDERYNGIFYHRVDGHMRESGWEGHGFSFSFRHAPQNHVVNASLPMKLAVKSPTPNFVEGYPYSFRKENRFAEVDKIATTRHAPPISQQKFLSDNFDDKDSPFYLSDEVNAQMLSILIEYESRKTLSKVNVPAKVPPAAEGPTKPLLPKENLQQGINQVKVFNPELALQLQEAFESLINAKSVPEKIKVLDVFAGIGGMSRGFLKTEKFDVPFAVEKNHGVAAIFMINHPDSFLFKEDVRIWFEKVKQAADINKNCNNPYVQVLNVDHLHFSPPCQKFSHLNTTGGQNDAENAEMTLISIDVARFFHQKGNIKSITMENVVGLLRRKDSDNHCYMKSVVASLFAMGFDVKLDVLDSIRYGDPQRRVRVFITAWKPNLGSISFPRETHGEKAQERLVTCFDVLHELSEVDPTNGNGLVEIRRPDDSYIFVENHTIEGTNQKKGLEPIKADQPAHTVCRKSNILHYKHKRTLTIREMSRLQSFDYSFKFCGSRKDQVNGIGNAVPVKMAMAVAEAVSVVHRNRT